MPSFHSMVFPLQLMRKKLTFSSFTTTVGAGSTVYLISTDQAGESEGGVLASEADVRTTYLVTRSALLRNFVVRARVPPGAGETFVYTVRVNGVATALTVTLAGAAVEAGSDLVNSVIVNVGSRVTVELVTSAGASVQYHAVELCFDVTLVRHVYEHVNFSTGGNTLGAGLTRWLGSIHKHGYRGTQFGSAENLPYVMYIAPRKGTIKNLVVLAGSAPGAGETFVYTVRVNGVATALTVTLAGAAVDTGFESTNIALVNQEDYVTVQIVTSGGAAVQEHLASLDFEEGDFRTGGL